MEFQRGRGDRRRNRAAAAAVALFAAIALAACGGAQVTPRTIYITLPPSSATPPATATPTVAPSALPTTAPGKTPAITPTPAPGTPTVSGQLVTAAAQDDSWTVSFNKPVIGGIATAGAINSSIGTRVDGIIGVFTGSELPAPGSGGSPSTLTGDFEVAFASPTVLSIRLKMTTSITGAAHPGTEPGSIAFNVQTGAVIQLPDLFSSPATALPLLRTQARAKLAGLLGGDLRWPATATMADFGRAWSFTPTGLELSWPQGEIAPAAAGVPTVTLPWAGLSGVIADPGPAAQFLH
jgi:hypothetical protein